jgi:hypothetical protein
VTSGNGILKNVGMRSVPKPKDDPKKSFQFSIIDESMNVNNQMEDSICLPKSGFGKSNGFDDSISMIIANKKDRDKPLTMRQSANMLGDLNSSSPALENFLKTG